MRFLLLFLYSFCIRRHTCYFVYIFYNFIEISKLFPVIPYYGIENIRTQPSDPKHSVLVSHVSNYDSWSNKAETCTLHENINLRQTLFHCLFIFGSRVGCRPSRFIDLPSPYSRNTNPVSSDHVQYRQNHYYRLP
jgi:hypothetical protein